MSKPWSAGTRSNGHPSKKAEQEKRTVVFVDEAGFSLLPMVVRTSAPRGRTPVLRVKLTRDHLSAIGGITHQRRLFMQMQERASKAEDVVRFLKMQLHNISGKLLIMWDGSAIHRAGVITPFLSSPMGKRVHRERLPGDTPEFNPQEQVWNLLTRHELKNLCCQDVAHLHHDLICANERLRHRQETLQRGFAHALAVVSLLLAMSIIG